MPPQAEVPPPPKPSATNRSRPAAPRQDQPLAATGLAPLLAVPWLVSLIIHVSALLLLALIVEIVPRLAPGDDGGEAGGTTLISSGILGADALHGDGDGETEYFTDSDPAPVTMGQMSPNLGGANLGLSLPDVGQEPTVSGVGLPTQLQQLPLPSEGGSGSAGAAASGGSPSGRPSFGGGTGSGKLTTGKGKGGWGKGVQTGIFGAQGTGSTFVYVFDRSESMTGPPLAAAKKELIQSLQQLGTGHQFQIVFYNQTPTIFAPPGSQTSSLVFADKQNKRQAADFTNNILAAGATRHMEALKAALGLHPDVIFFLTDAEDPQLSENELEEIRKYNRGTSINCIEFGTGLSPGGDNFLRRLARQNDGNHVYVNVNDFGR